MKLDFKQILMGFDGKTIKIMERTDVGDKYVDASLQEICIASLCNGNNSQGLSGKDKFDIGLLCEKIHKNDGKTDFTVDEIAKVKDYVGKTQSPAVTLSAWRALEGAAAK